jgi:hypothetical protein
MRRPVLPRTVLPRPVVPRRVPSRTVVAPVIPAARVPADPPFGLPEALATLHSAAPALGLGPAELATARVVQLVSTAVLEVGGLAVKIHPTGTDAPRLAAQGAVLDGDLWVPPVGPPVVTPHGVAVAYPWLVPAHPVSWPEVGGLLRAWHATPVDPRGLPRWTPLRRLPAQVAAYAELPDHDPGLVRLALAARESLLARVGALEPVLGTGVIHGDVSPSNVLRRGGLPVLIDSDFVAVGPLEYDLVAAAQRRERGEIDEATYLAFADAYGFDVRAWSGLGLVEEICGLGAVTFRLRCAVQRGEDVGWLGGALARYA